MTTMEQPASMEVDLTDVEDHDHDYTLKRPFEQVQVTQEVPHPEEQEEEEERQQHSSPKRAKTNNHMNEEKDNDMNEVEDDDDGDDYEQWRSQQARDPSSSPRGRKFRTLAEINEKDWQAIFTRLLQYKEIHGDCLVPEGYGNDRKCCKLGTWVAEQRLEYKRSVLVELPTGELVVEPSENLNAERIQKLNSIGFEWSVTNERTINEDTVATSPVEIEAASNTMRTPHSLIMGSNQAGASQPSSSLVSPIKNLPNDPNTNHAVASTASSANVHRAAVCHRLNQAQWHDMYARLQSYEDDSCAVPPTLDPDPQLATTSWVETQRNLWNPHDDHQTIGGSEDVMTSSDEPLSQDPSNNEQNHVSTVPPSPLPPPQDKWQDDRGGVVIMVTETTPSPPRFASVSLTTACGMAATAAICGAFTMLSAIVILIE